MAFEIKPDNYYLGFFYLDFPGRSPLVGKIGPFGRGGNLQMLLWKEGEDPPGDNEYQWEMCYRFRYYRDARIHKHGDEMNWFGGKTGAMTEAGAIELGEKFITISGMAINTKPHVWLIQGNNHKFYERAKVDPPYWMHIDPVECPQMAKDIPELTRINRPKPKILEGPMR